MSLSFKFFLLIFKMCFSLSVEVVRWWWEWVLALQFRGVWLHGRVAGLLHILKGFLFLSINFIVLSANFVSKIGLYWACIGSKNMVGTTPKKTAFCSQEIKLSGLPWLKRRLSYIVKVCSSRVVRLFDLESWKKLTSSYSDPIWSE